MPHHLYLPLPPPSPMDEEIPLLQDRHRSKTRSYLSSTVILTLFVILIWLGVRNEYSLHADLADGASYQVTTSSALDELSTTNKHHQKMPDLSQYVHLRTIPPDMIDIGNPERRVIIVGDIHGMKKSFDQLMHKVNYNPHNDFLVHVGDFLVRGPGSLELLSDFAARNISGVRGNHDQKVVEWRAFIDWIEGQPGGRAWLDEMERIDHIPNQSNKHHKSKNGWELPEGLEWGSQHWDIARKMSRQEYQYLLQLPLVLHIPSLHTHVVHAGLLPADPTKDLHSPKQPLSHLPEEDMTLPSDPGAIDVLRTAQEISILEDVPQNTKAWNNLNMRSVVPHKGTVSRRFADGTAWNDIWNEVIGHCHGFHVSKPKKGKKKGGRKRSRVFVGISEDDEDDGTSQQLDAAGDNDAHTSRGAWEDNEPEDLKDKPLACHPTTVVYGHSASRGLDVRRWTQGLDTGCAYGRRLTAMVLGGGASKHIDNLDQDEVEELSFGDSSKAQLVSVSCPKS